MVTVFGSFVLGDATDDQAVRPRPGDRDPHRRHHRADGARAGDDGAARRPQLVVPAVARPDRAPRSTSKASRRSPSPSRPPPTPAVLTTIGSPCPWRDSPTPSGAPPTGRSNVARVLERPGVPPQTRRTRPWGGPCAYGGNPRTTSSTRPTTTPTSTRAATTASPTARPASAGGSAWGTGRTRATPR